MKPKYSKRNKKQQKNTRNKRRKSIKKRMKEGGGLDMNCSNINDYNVTLMNAGIFNQFNLYKIIITHKTNADNTKPLILYYYKTNNGTKSNFLDPNTLNPTKTQIDYPTDVQTDDQVDKINGDEIKSDERTDATTINDLNITDDDKFNDYMQKILDCFLKKTE